MSREDDPQAVISDNLAAHLDLPYDAAKAPEFATRNLNGRSLTAAAQILNGPRINRTNRPKNYRGQPWQADAWTFYDEVGEFSWGVELLATSTSKVALVAARDVEGVDEPDIIDGQPTENEDGATVQPSEIELAAAELVGGFAGGSTGQQQLLYRVSVHLTVAGESFIVGRTLPDGDDKWEAYSNEEISWSQNSWKVNDGVEKYTLSDEDILIRVWRPHPKRRQLARSSTLPLLPVLSEIKGLTQSIAAQVDSRLAGAGLLILPESMTLLSSQTADVAEGEDPFVAELMDAMITPISNRDSAAAVVPIVIKVPDESIGKAQYLRFDAPTDVKDAEKRDAAVLRLARGMDLPPEQMLGMADTNHWGAWQIDEATIKGPISTLDAIICHALTIGWFRPALEIQFGEGAADDLLVWFDAAVLVQRPDRSAQAAVVFDHPGALSYEALLRESGLEAADLPEGEELCRVLLLSLLAKAPAQADLWFTRFGECAGIEGINLEPMPTPDAVPGQVVDGQDPGNVRNLPATQDDPDPALAASAAAACPDEDCLLMACEVAVLRALELAGKRMRGSSPRNVRNGLLDKPQHELHTILSAAACTMTMDDLVQDAWVPFDLAVGDRPALKRDLDDYVRLLIERREPHDRSWLRPIVARHQ